MSGEDFEGFDDVNVSLIPTNPTIPTRLTAHTMVILSGIWSMDRA